MQKRTLAILCASALALVVAGCGGSDNKDTTTTTDQAMTQPAGQDIVALAQGNADLSTLVKAVGAAGLVKTLQGKGPFTVFAPTNAAFAEIQPTVDKLLKPDAKADLTKVLTYHVVPGKILSGELADGQELTTVEGAKLKVSVDGDKVKIGDATVVKADVEASNGVVHVIDKVLVPPASN